MRIHFFLSLFPVFAGNCLFAQQTMRADQPAQLDIRASGEHGIQPTLNHIRFDDYFPYGSALAEKHYPGADISIRSSSGRFQKAVNESKRKLVIRFIPGNKKKMIVCKDQPITSQWQNG